MIDLRFKVQVNNISVMSGRLKERCKKRPLHRLKDSDPHTNLPQVKYGAIFGLLAGRNSRNGFAYTKELQV